MKKCCIIFILSLLSSTAMSQEALVEHFSLNGLIYVKEYDGKSVSVAGWDLESGVAPTGHINIPSTVTYKNKKYIVKYIQPWSFIKFKEITSITIPPTVKSIGAYTFSECEKLESVKIPNTVTVIGTGAFTNCI